MITDVPGVRVGQVTDAEHHTGVTVIRTDAGARGGLWVPGSATGSREWGALDPDHLAGEVHAVCFAGGSAFGLAACDGVMEVLAEEGVGFDVGGTRIPIVVGAILYDLHTATRRPKAVDGAAAARAASHDVAEGRVGAGAGARVGSAVGNPRPGGVGTASLSVDGYTVGALAAVNALGDIDARGAPDAAGIWRGQTTLVVVATDAPLSRPSCRVLAKMASAGMARALRPAFTPFDGDVVITLATTTGDDPGPSALLRLGDAAASVVEEAIRRGVAR